MIVLIPDEGPRLDCRMDRLYGYLRGRQVGADKAIGVGNLRIRLDHGVTRCS